MTESTVLQIGQEAAKMLAMLAGPMLLVSLVVGLGISIFQAVTQINEMTLSFVPKLIAIFVALFLLGPWLITKMTGYTVGLLDALPALGR